MAKNRNLAIGAALAAGAGAAAIVAKKHKDARKTEDKKTASHVERKEYRNTEIGKNQKNSSYFVSVSVCGLRNIYPCRLHRPSGG